MATTKTYGNGNQTIVEGSNETIIVGNGNDSITIGSSDTLTVGNGNDAITAGVNDAITLGRAAIRWSWALATPSRSPMAPAPVPTI